MSSVIKIFGLIIIIVIVTLLSLEYQKKIVINNDLVESVKGTQTKVIYDSIKLGKLRVDNTLELDEEAVLKNWKESFSANSDLNVNYQIKIVAININPPMIAVSVNASSSRSLSKNKLISNYDNVIIFDR